MTCNLRSGRVTLKNQVVDGLLLVDGKGILPVVYKQVTGGTDPLYDSQGGTSHNNDGLQPTSNT